MHVFHSVYPYEKLTISIRQIIKLTISIWQRSMSSPEDTSLKSMERGIMNAIHFFGEEKCAIDFSDARRPRQLRSSPSFHEFRTLPGPLDGAVKGC
ncbi:hypothetical protein CDAR_375091 [Caerostris darwini]|uniref:Uncharacterized protein n=1 Tax=Caerostris darwini TaxID=1538125 RepID=A0AAV4RKD1_9ARAC|nr:hypothetical protein CDAR_375091 [Caerostris darwini]